MGLFYPSLLSLEEFSPLSRPWSVFLAPYSFYSVFAFCGGCVHWRYKFLIGRSCASIGGLTAWSPYCRYHIDHEDTTDDIYSEAGRRLETNDTGLANGSSVNGNSVNNDSDPYDFEDREKKEVEEVSSGLAQAIVKSILSLGEARVCANCNLNNLHQLPTFSSNYVLNITVIQNNIIWLFSRVSC